MKGVVGEHTWKEPQYAVARTNFAKMKMSFPGGQHLVFFHADGTEGQMCEMLCSLNYEEKIDWRSEPALDSESWPGHKSSYYIFR